MKTQESLPHRPLPVASSRRLALRPSPAGQLPPPLLLLAVELLSNVAPTAAQIDDLSQIVLDQTAGLSPGAAPVAVVTESALLFPVFRLRIGIFSRAPNDAELDAAKAALAALALVTSGIPLRNLAIFVSLALLDRAADLELPGLQAQFAPELRLTDIDVRFDAGRNDLVTELTIERDGLVHGPWVATLQDQPVRVDLPGIEIDGELRHRFSCGPAAIEVRGGLGRRQLERKLVERKPEAVLCGLLDRLQIATILLGPDPDAPGNPPQAAEISWLEVERAADGVRLTGALELRDRSPQILAIEPTRKLALDSEPSISFRLKARFTDLREPLDYEWTLPDGGSFAQPGAASPFIVFNLAGSDPGDVFEKRVTVRVTDADGFSPELTRKVAVEVFSPSQFPDEFPDRKPGRP